MYHADEEDEERHAAKAEILGVHEGDKAKDVNKVVVAEPRRLGNVRGQREKQHEVERHAGHKGVVSGPGRDVVPATVSIRRPVVRRIHTLQHAKRSSHRAEEQEQDEDAI